MRSGGCRCARRAARSLAPPTGCSRCAHAKTARPHLLAHAPLALSASQDARAGRQRWNRPAPGRCRAAWRLQESAVVVHSAASGTPRPPHQHDRHPCAPLLRAKAPCPAPWCEKQSKLCGPGSRGPPHAEVPVVGSGSSALPPRPGAGSVPRNPPRATAAHHVVSHTERGPTAAATLRGSPPPQAFCGSLLSAHRCRFGTYCAVASFPEVPIPAWPPGSLLPDGKRHLSAGSTASGHVPPPAAMSNTSAVQPARSALALGLVGKQAMVDGVPRRQ